MPSLTRPKALSVGFLRFELSLELLLDPGVVSDLGHEALNLQVSLPGLLILPTCLGPQGLELRLSLLVPFRPITAVILDEDQLSALLH